jgi:hypothetical protein
MAVGKFELRAAYYAHLLRETGTQGGPLSTDAEELFAAFVAPWVPESQPSGAQGRLSQPLRAGLSRIAQHLHLTEKSAQALLKLFASEVAAYLRTEGTFTPKARIIDTVAEVINGADVVVAHSLGSVVAYETLWKYGQEVPLLVTVGSPLAFPNVVFPRLSPAPVDGLGAKPPGVGQWSNLADHGDIVAVPAGGVRRSFTGVSEDLHDTIARVDFHRLTNYLRSPVLGDILTRWHDSRQNAW